MGVAHVRRTHLRAPPWVPGFPGTTGLVAGVFTGNDKRGVCQDDWGTLKDVRGEVAEHLASVFPKEFKALDFVNSQRTMLAARAFAAGEVRCVEAPVPTPHPGELLVRTESASICGSDLHMALLGWGIASWPAPPGHPGHEAAGTVVESRGDRFKPGDRVLTAPRIWDSRCFAEYQNIDEAYVTPLPDDVSFEHATYGPATGGR